ncbi:uncharacterized protein LOC116223702 [Clupea harengus]|uniref:Uncharacterized protein LOC116223702 n=1 Tax=Clupea harengus TaxID=7950 RepID=A0A8M1KTP3_CLUHA|nr:uncharacterized protein LOC116223702 [Clupea harengus]
MVGLWTVLGLLLAGTRFSARAAPLAPEGWAAPLAPEAKATFSPGALGCGAQQNGQAQVQATGGLEAGHAQGWNEECPSLPGLVPAGVEAEAESRAEEAAAVAGGDGTRSGEGRPETAFREEKEGVSQERLVHRGAGEEEEEKEGGSQERLTGREAELPLPPLPLCRPAQSPPCQRHRHPPEDRLAGRQMAGEQRRRPSRGVTSRRLGVGPGGGRGQ